MAVTVALVVTELKMHRDLMEVKLLIVQSRDHARAFPPLLQTKKIMKGHSMIFCNCQVRGAVGDEVFYPVEMVEKVDQEVSHHCNSEPSHLAVLTIKQTEQRQFGIFRFCFQEREASTPREETEVRAGLEDTESNRSLFRRKVRKKSL